MNDDLPVLNEVLLEKTLEVIEAHPEHWLQESWRCEVTPMFAVTINADPADFMRVGLTPIVCGTAFCFAGWACDLDGGTWVGDAALRARGDDPLGAVYNGNISAARRAQHVLGLTDREVNSLFAPENDLTALRAQVGALLEGDRIRDRDL